MKRYAVLMIAVIAAAAFALLPLGVKRAQLNRAEEPLGTSGIWMESESRPLSPDPEESGMAEWDEETSSIVEQAGSAAPTEGESRVPAVESHNAFAQNSRPQQKPVSPSAAPPVSSRPVSSRPQAALPSSSKPASSLPTPSKPSAIKPILPNASSSRPASSKPQTPGVGDSALSYAEQVVKLVNQERAKAGLNALTIDRKAAAAAQVRAKETEINFSHTRPNGNSFGTALAEQGVSYRNAGENIAWGQKTPEQVMQAWMNSAGHRANILNAKFTAIGVGYYRNASGVNYWTQLFIG